MTTAKIDVDHHLELLRQPKIDHEARLKKIIAEALREDRREG